MIAVDKDIRTFAVGPQQRLKAREFYLSYKMIAMLLCDRYVCICRSIAMQRQSFCTNPIAETFETLQANRQTRFKQSLFMSSASISAECHIMSLGNCVHMDSFGATISGWFDLHAGSTVFSHVTNSSICIVLFLLNCYEQHN